MQRLRGQESGLPSPSPRWRGKRDELADDATYV